MPPFETFAAIGHPASMDQHMDEESGKSIKSLRALAAAEGECRRCPLYRDATQVVPGEGPTAADFMLVGEQPGDKEDLAGKPFVGPAGRILDSALKDAGIAREDTFVTNAVKHFKHEIRGKRRLHKRPNKYEIERCKIWLERERALVKPSTIIALGATAAPSLTGKTVTIAKMRRTTVELADGTKLVVTIHPSALLRIEDENDKRTAYGDFVTDLKAARAAAGKAPAKRGMFATRSAGFRRGRRCWPLRRFHHASLRQRRRNLLHAIDEIDGRDRRQHQAAGRITAAGDRRIRLDVVETGDAKLDAQGLTIEDQAGNGIGKSLDHIGAIDIANARGRAFRRSGRGRIGGAAFRGRFGAHRRSPVGAAIYSRRARFRLGLGCGFAFRHAQPILKHDRKDHAQKIRDQSTSPKREEISASKASTAAAACGPVAVIVIEVPGAAASIISPMIEVPPTVSWPRVTRTSASNFSTVCTNLAEARACRPFLLQITRARTTASSAACASGMRALLCPVAFIFRSVPGWQW